MKLHLLKFIALLLMVAMQSLVGSVLHAAPVLDLRQQDRARLSVDVRSSWQTAMVSANGVEPSMALDAETLWQLPNGRFNPGVAAPVSIKKGERFVGRLSALVAESPHDLLIELPMPRLDMAHLSYRYNNEAWTQASVGDQVPMAKWPFANRNAAFVIPPKVGELQIVLDIPVPGLFPSPVVLWGDAAFREDHTVRNVEVGAALALAFISLLLCAGAAVIFRRFAFVAVGVYSISIFLVSGGQGGIFGMFLWTETTWFNDYIKYVSAAIFGAMVPWTISSVVAQKHYSKFAANAATFWLVASMAAVLAMLFTVSRETQWALLSPFLIASLLFGLAIAIASVVRGQAHGVLSLAAVLMLCTGIFAPIAAYWGYLDGTFSFSISAISFWFSTTLLLLAVLLQYRHGNRVIARAQRSPGRDALTGLLNRDVFESKLARLARDAKSGKTHALFLYVAAGDLDKLERNYGGEGFESGMVQMAAALSSSISVVDTVARVATNAFGVLVEMPHEAKLGNALAQKIISRIMAVASHSAPMAQTARIVAAWVPTHGSELAELELACRQVLHTMDAGKRIGWLGVGSSQNHNAPKSAAYPIKGNLPGSRSRAEELNSLINNVEDSLRQEAFVAVNKKGSGETKETRRP